MMKGFQNSKSADSRGSGVAAHGFVSFEFFQDGKLGAAEHGFGAVIETHFVGVLRVGG